MAKKNDTEKKDKKKLTRAEKKELKKERKLAIKEAKKNGTYNPEDWEDEDEGIGLIIVAVFFILAVWLAIFAVIIRMDIGGIGSSFAYPLLKNVPVINKILPKTDIPAEKAYTYETMDEAISRIQELERQLAEKESAGAQSDSKISDLEAQVAALLPYKDNVDSFNEERQKFYQEVVFSDKAPDIKEYKSYYESIDPANAELLYKQVVQQLESKEAINDYAQTYSSMEPAQAAAIFDEMKDNYTLVAGILRAMSAEDRGKILAAMDKENAANLTRLLDPK